MSEGELKKRVMKSGRWVNGGTIEGVLCFGERWETDQKTVMLAIDSAKKDFPKPYDIPQRDWNFSMEKIFKWHKKWFGDSV